MRFRFAVLLLPLFLLVSGSASGANAPDIQQYKPVTDTHNFLLVHDAELLHQFRPSFAVHFNYAMQPLEVQGLGVQREFGLVDGIVGIDLTGRFAIFDWWEMGLHFPVTQVPITTEIVGSSPTFGEKVPYGIGDIRIETRLRPLDPATKAIGLAANLFLTLPTGTSAAWMGRGKPGGGLRVAISQSWSRFHFAANLGYAFYPSATVSNLTTDDEFTYGLGVGASILVDRLDINLEFDGSLTPGPAEKDGAERFGDGVHSPLEMLLSLRYKMKNGLSIHGGVGKGLTAGFGTPELRFLAGVSWGIFRRGIPGYRARIRPIVSRITIHWPSFYNVVTGKTLALPNLIALQHIPLSPAGVIAKRPAPIALPNSCAAEWRMAPDAVFSPYASVRYFTPHMVHSQYNLL